MITASQLDQAYWVVKNDFIDLINDLETTLLNKKLPYELRLVHVWRSPAKQFELYKKGRSLVSGRWRIENRSKVVTYATADKTPHCRLSRDHQPASCAIDLAFVRDGKYAANNDPIWALIPAAVACNHSSKLVSGAMFSRIRDWGHVELADWRQRRTKGEIL